MAVGEAPLPHPGPAWRNRRESSCQPSVVTPVCRSAVCRHVEAFTTSPCPSAVMSSLVCRRRHQQHLVPLPLAVLHGGLRSWAALQHGFRVVGPRAARAGLAGLTGPGPSAAATSHEGAASEAPSARVPLSPGKRCWEGGRWEEVAPGEEELLHAASAPVQLPESQNHRITE